MKKRGQFTILVVFGLIALITIALFLAFRSSMEQEKADITAENAISDFLKVNSVSGYVDSCMKAVSEQAIKLVALQGGNLWSDQGGPVEMESTQASAFGRNYLPVHYKDQDYNVGYVLNGIDKAACSKLRNNFQPPEYPYPDKTIDELNDVAFFRSVCSADRNSGFYGSRNVKALCVINGPNWKGDPNRPSVYSTCEGVYDYPRGNPIQHQLSFYTENNLAECTDFGSLEQRHGFEVEIVNTPKVEFLFGREDVLVNATYPVRVSFDGRPPVNTRISFNHRIDVRLKELYEFFWDLMLKEAWSSGFDLDVNHASSNFFRNGFKVQIFKDYCQECGLRWNPSVHDDLIIVQDIHSQIQGESLTIIGVIKNRGPVLDRVRKTFMVDFSDDVNRKLAQEYGVDIVAVNSSIINIEPFGVDPDGDSVNYNYDLWLGNYTVTSTNLPGNCRANLNNFLEYLSSGSAPAAYRELDKFFTRCPEDAQILSNTNKWEASLSYQDNKKDGKVTVPRRDNGLHKTRVTASDAFSLDYQDLNILIFSTEWLSNNGFEYVLECDSMPQDEFSYCG